MSEDDDQPRPRVIPPDPPAYVPVEPDPQELAMLEAVKAVAEDE